MQAPLSSTASGQKLRIGPPRGLAPSTLAPSSLDYGRPPGPGRRLRAWSNSPSISAAEPPVAEGVGLAHDAGNLLGALGLYCDLLALPGVLREEHRHYAEELQLLSRRSGALIDRLLNPATTAFGRSQGQGHSRGAGPGWGADFGRGDAAEAPAWELVVVPEVIEQCRGLLSMIARRAVEVVYGAGVGEPVPVPREAVERILVNLTKNAAEASAGGGAITLRVSRVDAGPVDGRVGTAGREGQSRIVLSVEDQGCGMSVAAVKVLLERAPLNPAALERPGGDAAVDGSDAAARGLGLRVVRELVRESGGELRLKSRSGCGTTVEIAWAVAGTSPARTPGPGPGAGAGWNSQTVATQAASNGSVGEGSC